MTAPAGVLEAVLALLLREESALGRLIELAVEEQRALIASDFASLDAISAEMVTVSAAIEVHETERLNLLRTIGAEARTIEELTPLADDHGVEGFTAMRLRLSARAYELKDAQERNARLLLNAMKVRDRWANLSGGVSSPTYGAQGQRHPRDGSGFVSRSA